MAYASRSRFRKSASSSYRRSRFGSRGVTKVAYRKKRTPYTRRLKFATVGYARDVETKYSDKAIYADAIAMQQAGANGWWWNSTDWSAANLGGNTGGGGSAYVQDLLKGVVQGTTATTRVGNKIKVKCMKVKMTLNACSITNNPANYENAQYGESAYDRDDSSLRQMVRTTYRVLVVKDLQVNSQANTVRYDDVMESNPDTGMSGVHSELKVENMGRFRVMSDRLIQLDADDPMKTLALTYYNIGTVRYNGPGVVGTPALTDHGIYIVWACWTQGNNGATSIAPIGFDTGRVVVSRRICFTDS